MIFLFSISVFGGVIVVLVCLLLLVEYKVVNKEPVRGLKMLGIGKEFSRGDKFLYYATYTWIISWFLVFVAGTILNLVVEISNEVWMDFWYVYIMINIGIAMIVTIWFTIGGFIDIKAMFKRLRTMKRDHRDDGRVIGHISAYEVEEKA